MVQNGVVAPGQTPWQVHLVNTWGEFDGIYMKWQAFHDAFVHSVYRNNQKLQLLKTALKGKAEWMITDRNDHRPRFVLHAHMNILQGNVQSL